MDWQKASREGSFTAEGFAFLSGEPMDARLAYRTLGALAPGGGNAVTAFENRRYDAMLRRDSSTVGCCLRAR